MNRFVKAALGCAFLATPGVAWAEFCDDMPTQSHEVRVLFNGFYPTTLYACPGDTVTFINKTGRYAEFKVKDEAASSYYPPEYKYYWTAPNASRNWTITTGSEGFDLGSISLSGDSNPNQYEGFIVFSAPPTG